MKCFSAKELEKSLTDAGFEIDYQWQPNNEPRGQVLFGAFSFPFNANRSRQ